MRKWEFRKHWIVKRKRSLLIGLGMIGSLHFIYKTQFAATAAHYIEVIRWSYKNFLVPEYSYEPSALEATFSVSYKQTGWDKPTEDRLSNLFIKTDWGRPEGSTGKFWGEIFEKIDFHVYLPPEVSLVQFLQILKAAKIPENKIKELENTLEAFFAKTEEMQAKISEKVYQYNKVVSDLQQKEDLKNDQDYMKSFKEVLLSRRRKLMEKKKRRPDDLRLLHKLDLINEDLKQI